MQALTRKEVGDEVDGDAEEGHEEVCACQVEEEVVGDAVH
jgi:hypothetical protein